MFRFSGPKFWFISSSICFLSIAILLVGCSKQPPTPVIVGANATGSAQALEGSEKKESASDQKTSETEKAGSTAENQSKPQAQYHVAFSEGGTLAVSGGKNATVRLFDVDKGVLTRTFSGQSEPISAISLSRDENSIAVGSETGDITFWNAVTAHGLDEFERESLEKSEKRKLKGHAGPITSLAFRPDGQEIASGGEDGFIRRWRIPVAEPITLFATSDIEMINGTPGGETFLQRKKDGSIDVWNPYESRGYSIANASVHPITALEASPDGSLAAAGDSNGRLRIFDLKSRKIVKELNLHQGEIAGIRFHPKLPQLVTIGVDGATRWVEIDSISERDEKEREICKFPLKSRICSCSRDGSFAAIAGENQIEVADLKNSSRRHKLPTNGADVATLAWTSDSKALVAGDNKGRLISWRVQDFQRVFDGIVHDGPIRAIVANPTTAEILSGGADAMISIWSNPGLPELMCDSVFDGATSVAVSQNGESIAVGNSEGLIRVVDVGKKNVATEFSRTGNKVDLLRWSQDSEWLAAADSDGTIRTWKIDQGARSMSVLSAGAAISQIEFHSTGPTLIALTSSGEFRTWKLPLQSGLVLSGHQDPITSILSNSTGSEVFTGGGDRVCRLYEVNSGKQLRLFEGPRNEVTCLTKAIDDEWVAAGDLDGKITMWWTSSGQMMGTTQTANAAVTSITTSPSGSLLASSSSDGFIRVWKAPFKAPLILDGNPGKSASVSASQDGRKIAMSRPDNSIVIYDASTGREKQVLSGHTGEISCLEWSNDSSFVASASLDGRVCLWSSVDGKRLAEWHAGAVPITSLAISRDSNVITACLDSGRTTQYSKGNEEETVRCEALKDITTVALSLTGKRVAFGQSDGSVRLMDCMTGETLGSTPTGGKPVSISWCGDELTWVSVDSKKNVKYWNLMEPDISRGWIDAPAGLTKLSVSTDGSRVLGICADGTIYLWDGHGQIQRMFECGKDVGRSKIAISNDASQVIAAGFDGRTTVFEVALVQVIKAHPGRVDSIRFVTEDHLISSGDDQTIRGWNLKSGAQERLFEGCSERVIDLFVSPSTSQLISLSDDNALHCWNLETGKAIDLSERIKRQAFIRLGGGAADREIAFLDSLGQVTVARLPDFDEITKFSTELHAAAGIAFVGKGTVVCALNKQAYVLREQSEIAKPESNSEAIVSIAASPTSDQVFTATRNGKIQAWTLGGRSVITLAEDAGSIRSLAICGDESQFLATNDANEVTRRTFSGEILGTARLEPNCQFVHFASDHSSCVVTSPDGLIRKLDLSTGKPVCSLFTMNKHPLFSIYQKKSIVYAISDEGSLCRYALEPTLKANSGQRDVRALSVSESGEFLASGGSDSTVCIWKTRDLTKGVSLRGHAKAVTQIEFARDNSLLISASEDKSVRIWNAQDARTIHSIPLSAPPNSISASPDNLYLAIALNDKPLTIVDLKTGKAAEASPTGDIPICWAKYESQGFFTIGADRRLLNWGSRNSTKQFPGQPSPLTDLDVVQDGSYFVTAGPESGIALFDFSGKRIADFERPLNPIKSISVSADGLFLAGISLTQSPGSVITIWNVADRRIQRSISVSGVIRSIEFERLGASLLVQADNRMLYRYDASNGDLLESIESVADIRGFPVVLTSGEIATIESDDRGRAYQPALSGIVRRHNGQVTSLQYSGNGNILFSGGVDGRVVGSIAERNEVAAEFNLGNTAITSIRLAPNQNSLIATSSDKYARIWTLEGGQTSPESVFQHKAAVKCSAISQSGQLLATGGADKIIHLWNLESGRELAQFHGHEESLQSLEIARDGNSIISFGEENAVRVWKIPSAALNSPNEKNSKINIEQVNTSSGKVMISQPQDQQIVTLQQRLQQRTQQRMQQRMQQPLSSSNISSSASDIQIHETDELTAELEQMRSGRIEKSRSTQPPITRTEQEMRQTVQRLNKATKPKEKEKLRSDLRKIKKRQEIEEKLSNAQGSDSKDLLKELANLESMDPRSITLNAEERYRIPGMAVSQLLSLKTDYVFDFRKFHPVKLKINQEKNMLATGREATTLSNQRKINGVVELWDIGSGVRIRRKNIENLKLRSLVFSPSQEYLYTLPSVSVMQLSSGVMRVLTADSVAVTTRDGTQVAIGLGSKVETEQQILKLLDTSTFQYKTNSIGGYESKISALVFNPKGDSFYAAIRERLIHKLVEVELPSMEMKGKIEEFKHPLPWHVGEVLGIEALCMSQDARYLIGYGQYNSDDYRWTLWERIRDVSDGPKWLRKFTKQTDTPMLRDNDPSRMWFVGGNAVVCMEDPAGILHLLDLETGEFHDFDREMIFLGRPESAHSDDGVYYAVGDGSGQLKYWDLTKIKLGSKKFKAHSGPVVGVALSDDGTRIITAGEENEIKIWEAEKFENPPETNSKAEQKSSKKQRPK